MTLAEIRAAYPALFYGQEWFNGSQFMNRVGIPFDGPLFLVSARVGGVETYAADLAATYVRKPDSLIWRSFLWTDDFDDHGNRIYCAGLGQYGCEGFQIHRELTPTAWWVMQ